MNMQMKLLFLNFCL